MVGANRRWLLDVCRRGAQATVVAGACLLSPAALVVAGELPSNLNVVLQASGYADEIPDVLSAADAERYRKIFALQTRGDWKGADRIVATLQNKVLMGRVLHQRYMHPTAYRSSFRELSDWLARYADQPGAERVHGLALSRMPKGSKAPRAPSTASLVVVIGDGEKADPPESKELRKDVEAELALGHPQAAEARLRTRNADHLLGRAEGDRLRWRVATAYFFDGEDEKALDAARAASRSRTAVPMADWIVGLAAWRLEKWDLARTHFEALAESPTASDWNVAAAAYWAARANLVTQRPSRVNDFLALAADRPRTFYGLIAARLLGREFGFNWTPPPLTPEVREQVLQSPAIQRTVALRQVGEIYWAEQEVHRIFPRARTPERMALLGVAHRLGLAAAELRLSQLLQESEGELFDASTYPLPAIAPDQGPLDRALLYAFMRQESGFNARATSPRGAVGLMQLMPRTASWMADDASLRRDGKDRLYSPELNVELGQRYLAHLLELDEVQGDLFRLAAAYNAGPGKLRSWLRRMKHAEDPLLFLESIPTRETRLFVERVAASFWIYRDRFGQETPTLDAVAAGARPFYFAFDGIATAAGGGPTDADAWD